MKKFMWVLVMLAVAAGLYFLANQSSNAEPEPVPTPTQSTTVYQPTPEEAHNNLFHSDSELNDAAECDQALDRALTGIVDDPEGEALALLMWTQCRAQNG
jgi:hypothetical protein